MVETLIDEICIQAWKVHRWNVWGRVEKLLQTLRLKSPGMKIGIEIYGLKLGFPTERDSATFRDKGTEVHSLSRDKGSKSCHGTGRARTAYKNPGQDAGRDNHYFSDKIWDGMWDRTITNYFPMISCFRTSFSCFRMSLFCFLFFLGKWYIYFAKLNFHAKRINTFIKHVVITIEITPLSIEIYRGIHIHVIWVQMQTILTIFNIILSFPIGIIPRSATLPTPIALLSKFNRDIWYSLCSI